MHAVNDELTDSARALVDEMAKAIAHDRAENCDEGHRLDAVAAFRALAHPATGRGWVECRTCEGKGALYAFSPGVGPLQSCPDCFDGLVPPAKLVQRVASIYRKGWALFRSPDIVGGGTELGDSEYEQVVREILVLAASVENEDPK